jgi:type VII secretion protein EccB
MATKRDLVEAHSFNRRRLVTAFLSGAPGGREVEPVRYGRTLAGGIVLAALLVAGAAVAGVLKPAVGDAWREDGLVIAKDSGSRFVQYQGTLFPVINITSARLALSSEKDLKVSYVPDDVLVDEPKGQPIGIPGAPDYLTPASLLVPSGWSACTNEQGGLTVDVSDTPGTRRAAEDSLLVRAENGRLWLVSGSRRYEVPRGAVGQSVLRGLGVSQEDPFPASTAWLDLVPQGEPLAPLQVPGSGSRSSDGSGALTVVGTPVSVDGTGYVLARRGLVQLSDFAYDVYTATSSIEEQQADVRDVQSIPPQSAQGIVPSDWPTERPRPSTDRRPCLQLVEGTDGAASRPVLATADRPEARASGAARTVRVEQGRGALVRSTTRDRATASDTTFLVDARGTRFAIGPKDNVPAVLGVLGYGSVEPVATPRAWVELFASGPELSPAAAVKAADGAQQ